VRGEQSFKQMAAINSESREKNKTGEVALARSSIQT
jgi:hypothetical protein